MSTDITPGSSGAAPASTGEPASTGAAPASTGVAPASTGAALMGWDETWRQRIAAGSTDAEKELAQLARYESPESIWKKARELERRMSAGELRSALPKNASEDERKRWRAENGIPAVATEYKINMPQGKKLEEDDKPFIEAFAKSAHEANFTQEQFDKAVAGFYGEVDRQERALTEAEGLAVKKAEEDLRGIWGAEYTVNKNLAEAFLDRAPAGFRDRFWNGFLSDHMPIRASVDMWRWLAETERQINPAATVLPGQSTNLGQTLDAELTSLRKLMANPKSEYYIGAQAEALQARYRQLLNAQAGVKKKAGATA